MRTSLFYDLKSDSSLPPNAYFKDPYDDHVYRVNSGETLPTFMDRILTRKEKEGHPKLVPVEFRASIIVAFSNNADNRTLQTYFTKRGVSPTFGQMLAFMDSTLKQYWKGAHVSFQKRHSRAVDCMSCAQHDRRGSIAKSLINGANTLLGFRNLSESAEEKSLGRCSICGCALKTKVKMNLMNVIGSITPNHIGHLIRINGPKAFDRCWILKELLQDPRNKQILEGKLRHAGPQALQAYREYLEQNPRNSV